MGGSNTVGPDYDSGQAGVYGVKGILAPKNIPGGRAGSFSWIDKNGNLWLFGGGGYDANDISGELNDLWVYSLSNNEWAWMGGSSTVGSGFGQPGVYGVKGTPALTNIPGGRDTAVSWTDGSGNFWLFGGNGHDVYDNNGYPNDLWRYEPIEPTPPPPIPQITWSAPATIVYGTNLSTVLTASSDVPGRFGAYTLSTGETVSVSTVLPAGQYQFGVFFTPSAGGPELHDGVRLTVLPATLTVTPNNVTATRGAEIPKYTYTITGFVNGDSPTVVRGVPTLFTTPAIGRATSVWGVSVITALPGTYTIHSTWGSLSAKNYTFSFGTGTLTITSAQLR